jgi:tetratricopeptide (TPR) repeat protein
MVMRPEPAPNVARGSRLRSALLGLVALVGVSLVGGALVPGGLLAPAAAQTRADTGAFTPPADPVLRQSLKEALFDQLKAAGSEAEGDVIADRIWRIWMIGPDDAATETMRQAMARRDLYDFAGAHEILDTLVAAHPDWAEVWNQRAYVRFLQERYDRSLEDIDKALEREPKHFGALAGRALVLMRQGRIRLGQKALRAALEVHPWARERAMLIPIPGEETPGADEDDAGSDGKKI